MAEERKSIPRGVVVEFDFTAAAAGNQIIFKMTVFGYFRVGFGNHDFAFVIG